MKIPVGVWEAKVLVIDDRCELVCIEFCHLIAVVAIAVVVVTVVVVTVVVVVNVVVGGGCAVVIHDFP